MQTQYNWPEERGAYQLFCPLAKEKSAGCDGGDDLPKNVPITLECFGSTMHLKCFCLSGKSQSYALSPVFRS